MKSSITFLLAFFVVLNHEGTAQTEPPMIGRPDGHERKTQDNSAMTEGEKPLLGLPDGHELRSEDMTESEKPLLGLPDGHELRSEDVSEGEKPLLGLPDGHERESEDVSEGEKPLLGLPDGHERESEDESSDADEDDYSDELVEFSENVLEEFGSYSEAEDENQPLIRCKRPLCSVNCENGFETDASGCEVCQCKTSESSLIGRPDGHESVANDCSDRIMCLMYCVNGFKTGDDGCPVCECSEDSVLDHKNELAIACRDQPLCRMFCELGFKTDDRGCPICLCLEDPCQGVVCESGSECQAQSCEDIKSCTQLSANCVSTPKSLPCPEPMCANECPFGYVKNEAGCMTCVCDSIPAERVCGTVNCKDGLICRNGTDESFPKCSIKSICETRRSLPVGLGSTSLLCEADGSFKPLQCNPKKAECWCVDGLGQEVMDTRVTVFVDEHKPKCPRNITVSMHLHMTLVVQHDIDISGELDSLNGTIVDHVSSWLLIEPHYIRVAKAEAVSSDLIDGHDSTDDSDADADLMDDYTSYDKDELDSSRLILVELVVLHDGQSDLPSAANYMQRRMHMGLCKIPVGKGSLMPNPYTLKTVHQFSHQSVFPEYIAEPDRCVVDPKSWTCQRMVRVVICAVVTGVFIVAVAVLVSVLYRRRRMRLLQFKHQRLVSQISVEKNCLNGESEKSLQSDHDTYMTKEEKLPIA